MTNDSDFRKIYTSKENFDRLRFDQKFARLLNLARTVNAVYFCFKSLLDHSGDETPAGQRQHINAFLFATGVLHEGFTVAERLEKHFGDRDSYRNGFGKLLADPNTQELRKAILKRMRDKFVFHYDKDVAEQTLKKIDLKEYVFATGTGGKRKGTYYNLADEIVINYMLNDVPLDEQDAVFRATLKSIGESLSAFIDCADALMGEVLSEDTWILQRGESS
ncbi:MAG TPA: hypothetical protein VGN86_13915 [Pyrinomonadaceae bacterium]|jgi:hypothetical protein|nr:hypothetical protein [Pyrinomonadaceae bacterium]